MNVGAFVRLFREVDLRALTRFGARYTHHRISALRRDVSGVWTPTAAVIELTYDCPRHCKNCYVSNGRDMGHMSQELLVKIVTVCAAQPSIHLIALIGGEPVVPANISKIAHVVRSFPSTIFTVTTNGDYFANHGLPDSLRDLHNLTFPVSLDGMCRETNDAIRGPGSFNNVLAAFECLRRSRSFLGAAVVIRQHNYQEVTSRDFLHFLADHGVKLAFFMRERGEPELSHKDYLRATLRIKRYAFGRSPFVKFGSVQDQVALSGQSKLMINPRGEMRVSKTDLAEGSSNDVTLRLPDMVIPQIAGWSAGAGKLGQGRLTIDGVLPKRAPS